MPHLRVPVAVVEDDGVGGGEIDAEATTLLRVYQYSERGGRYSNIVRELTERTRKRE